MSDVDREGFELVGLHDLLEAAVNRLHVCGDRNVLGVDLGGLTHAGESAPETQTWRVWVEPGSNAVEVLHGLPGVHLSALPADAAREVWTGLEADTAFQLGALFIRPPWVDAPVPAGCIELVIPRGSAFGSGEHGSTRAALQALESLVGDWSGTSPKTFLDVGTGSGILLAWARARGIAGLAACEIEGPAVTAARALIPEAVIVHGDVVAVRSSADLVVANLTAAEQHGAVAGIQALWTQAAPLVLSGMREHEVDGVLRLYGREPKARFADTGYHAVVL